MEGAAASSVGAASCSSLFFFLTISRSHLYFSHTHAHKTVDTHAMEEQKQLCCETPVTPTSATFSLSLSHRQGRGGRRSWTVDTEIFPAGARTPPWAHRRPSLFFVFTGYIATTRYLLQSVHGELYRQRTATATQATKPLTHAHASPGH
jgi:hypothetical protein